MSKDLKPRISWWVAFPLLIGFFLIVVGMPIPGSYTVPSPVTAPQLYFINKGRSIDLLESVPMSALLYNKKKVHDFDRNKTFESGADLTFPDEDTTLVLTALATDSTTYVLVPSSINIQLQQHAENTSEDNFLFYNLAEAKETAPDIEVTAMRSALTVRPKSDDGEVLIGMKLNSGDFASVLLVSYNKETDMWTLAAYSDLAIAQLPPHMLDPIIEYKMVDPVAFGLPTDCDVADPDCGHDAGTPPTSGGESAGDSGGDSGGTPSNPTPVPETPHCVPAPDCGPGYCRCSTLGGPSECRPCPGSEPPDNPRCNVDGSRECPDQLTCCPDGDNAFRKDDTNGTCRPSCTCDPTKSDRSDGRSLSCPTSRPYCCPGTQGGDTGTIVDPTNGPNSSGGYGTLTRSGDPKEDEGDEPSPGSCSANPCDEKEGDECKCAFNYDEVEEGEECFNDQQGVRVTNQTGVNPLLPLCPTTCKSDFCSDPSRRGPTMFTGGSRSGYSSNQAQRSPDGMPNSAGSFESNSPTPNTCKVNLIQEFDSKTGQIVISAGELFEDKCTRPLEPYIRSGKISLPPSFVNQNTESLKEDFCACEVN